MSSAPIPGFITKKQASDTYNRSHRQLTRDLGQAMKAQDENVLSHFKLRTEDGVIHDGTSVTNELIAQLRSEGRNPMWYVRADWMERTYGERASLKTAQLPEQSDISQSGGPDDSHEVKSGIVSMLQHRISELEQDKQDLRTELRIKNDQIKEANDREKETNVLMRDLHELMRDMQQRLLPPPQTSRQPSETPALSAPHQEPPLVPTTSLPPPDVMVFGSDQKPQKLPPLARRDRQSKRRPKPAKAHSRVAKPSTSTRQKTPSSTRETAASDKSNSGQSTAVPKPAEAKRGFFARLFH